MSGQSNVGSTAPRHSRRYVLAVVTAGLAARVLGCQKHTAQGCADTSQLTPAELMTRSALEYRDVTLRPAETCDNCALYRVPVAGHACGGCVVVMGPIAPRGYCRNWRARPG